MGRAAVFCVVTANQIPRQAVIPSENIHIVESRSRKLYALGFMLHYNISETEKQEKAVKLMMLS